MWKAKKLAAAKDYVSKHLEPDRIRIFWDNDDDTGPADLRRELLNFSGLVPPGEEYEDAFRDRIPVEHWASTQGYGEEVVKRAKTAFTIEEKAKELKALQKSKKQRARRRGPLETIWVDSLAGNLVFARMNGDGDSSRLSKLKTHAQLPLVENSRTRLWELMEPEGSAIMPAEPVWGAGTPDLILGLPVYQKEEVDKHNLDDLYESSRLQSIDDTNLASPIELDYLLCFPWGVYEAKRGFPENTTDLVAWWVYVQVARAAVMCAASLEKISEVYGDQPGNAQPVLAFTSIGQEWSVFLCYRHYGESTPFWHVSRIWNGDMTNCWNALQLLHIVDCAKDWAANSFERWIAERLNMIYKLPPAVMAAPAVQSLPSPTKGSPSKSRKRIISTPTPLTSIRPKDLPRENASANETGSPVPRRSRGRFSILSDMTDEESYYTAEEGSDEDSGEDFEDTYFRTETRVPWPRTDAAASEEDVSKSLANMTITCNETNLRLFPDSTRPLDTTARDTSPPRMETPMERKGTPSAVITSTEPKTKLVEDIETITRDLDGFDFKFEYPLSRVLQFGPKQTAPNIPLDAPPKLRPIFHQSSLDLLQPQATKFRKVTPATESPPKQPNPHSVRYVNIPPMPGTGLSRASPKEGPISPLAAQPPKSPVPRNRQTRRPAMSNKVTQTALGPLPSTTLSQHDPTGDPPALFESILIPTSKPKPSLAHPAIREVKLEVLEAYFEVVRVDDTEPSKHSPPSSPSSFSMPTSPHPLPQPPLLQSFDPTTHISHNWFSSLQPRA